jgi:hypothetical protein
VRAAECAEIVALDVFKPRRRPASHHGACCSAGSANYKAHHPSSPKPGLHYAVLDASDDVVCLAERREPLTAQARARIN